MTTDKTGVDAPPEVMWSVSRVADRDGISKQAVSKRVRDLAERHALQVERNGMGAITALNVVQYDLLRSRYGDPSKAQAPPRPEEGEEGDEPAPARTPAAPSRNSYEEATRQKAWFDVEKRRLEAAELRGLLIRRDLYEAAVGTCSDEMVRVIDLLPQEADALAVELGLDDVHLVRIALKGLARRLRVKLSKAFETLQAGAPALDEPVADFMEGNEEA